MLTIEDLYLEGGDIVYNDVTNNPITFTEEDAIAQDIKHRLLESGLKDFLIAARPDEKSVTLQQMLLIIEEDKRIQPGSAEVFEPNPGEFHFRALRNNNQEVTSGI